MFLCVSSKTVSDRPTGKEQKQTTDHPPNESWKGTDVNEVFVHTSLDPIGARRDSNPEPTDYETV